MYCASQAAPGLPQPQTEATNWGKTHGTSATDVRQDQREVYDVQVTQTTTRQVKAVPCFETTLALVSWTAQHAAACMRLLHTCTHATGPAGRMMQTELQLQHK